MLYLLAGYMFLFIHRPFEVWPALGEMRLELVYMLLAGLVWVTFAQKDWIANRLHVAFLLFTGAVVISWLVSPWQDKSGTVVEDYLKLLVFYGMLVTVVRGEESLRFMVKAFLVVMALYMLHSLWEYHNGRHFYRMDIHRLVGVDTSFGDPNAFGASIVYALPLVLIFWRRGDTDRARATRTNCLVAGYVAVSVLCVVLTGSRAAFVGLLLFALLLGWHTRWRLRLGVAALVLSPLLWFLIPGELQDRFATIVDPARGPTNAQTSAEGRIEGLRMGLDQWLANAVTGCGPGAWRPATGSTIESHTLYGQLPGELGTLGILTFGGVLLCLLWNVRRINAAYRDHPERVNDFPLRLNKALGLAFLLMLFGGLFGHNLFRHNWLWYGSFLIVAQQVVAERLSGKPSPCGTSLSSERMSVSGRAWQPALPGGNPWIGTRA
ncbi:MAG: O-antigen ligase family protein [Planctomycetes bacterium]|nr:O-antigen ligase family protein [Planctomycetota bacterium]